MEYRRVYSVGHSLAVTLPPACLRLLGVSTGGTVQIVPQPSGKVVIAPMHIRVGAQQELAAAAREVVYLRRLVGKLRKRAMAAPAATIARGVSIGYAKAWKAELMDLSNQVKEQRDELRAFHVWLYGQIAPPIPSSSPDSSEGGAVASGGHPPGHPLEH